MYGSSDEEHAADVGVDVRIICQRCVIITRAYEDDAGSGSLCGKTRTGNMGMRWEP
jgi:hypothetical protein